MVQMLLNANADPNIKERFGHTAVELAASKGDLATMKVFQKKVMSSFLHFTLRRHLCSS